MYEIELKAWVDNREATRAALNAFATYSGAVAKSDTYYALHREPHKISARIRTVTTAATNKTQIFLTYKRKERCIDADGVAIEVNDEKECELSSSEAVETLLQDSGFAVSLTKTKQVESWQYDDALFELCTVPPLGDFLEIEILSPTNDSKTVTAVQKKLTALLAKAGIPAEKIEHRYYSALLRALKNHQ